MSIKIVHISSVHQRYDTRIFLKECCSLFHAGYEVSLVTADGMGNECRDGVNIVDVGKSASRFRRALLTTRKLLTKAIELDAAIYHLHDPELMPLGIKLKKYGKRVIFDAHEDFPKQILGKSYLWRPLRIILSWTVKHYEVWACQKFDAIVAATPYIRDKFLNINANAIDVNNFPLPDELIGVSDPTEKFNEVAYVGDISKIRGIEEVVSAMDYTQGVKLNLAGKFNEKIVEEKVKNLPSWSKVNQLGFLDRQGVRNVLSKSMLGIVTLHPTVNYLESLPIKMFEYMSASIPVVASNFPLWQEIIEGNHCGICVDPFDSSEIGKAIQYLIEHPLEARLMGENGRRLVEEKCNWLIEEKKLLTLYRQLIQ